MLDSLRVHEVKDVAGTFPEYMMVSVDPHLPQAATICGSTSQEPIIPSKSARNQRMVGAVPMLLAGTGKMSQKSTAS